MNLKALEAIAMAATQAGPATCHEAREDMAYCCGARAAMAMAEQSMDVARKWVTIGCGRIYEEARQAKHDSAQAEMVIDPAAVLELIRRVNAAERHVALLTGNFTLVMNGFPT